MQPGPPIARAIACPAITRRSSGEENFWLRLSRRQSSGVPRRAYVAKSTRREAGGVMWEERRGTGSTLAPNRARSKRTYLRASAIPQPVSAAQSSYAVLADEVHARQCGSYARGACTSHHARQNRSSSRIIGVATDWTGRN
jgi:hypothetical protein